MIVFQDANNKSWRLDCNIQSVADIERETGVSIYTLLDDQCKPLQQVLSTPAVLANCVYLMLVGNAPVTPQEFGRGIKGDALERLVNAFLEAITDFFPDARRRAALEKLRQTWALLQEKTLDQLEREFAKIDPQELSQQAMAELTKSDPKHMQKLRPGSGKRPASSGSTRGR